MLITPVWEFNCMFIFKKWDCNLILCSKKKKKVLHAKDLMKKYWSRSDQEILLWLISSACNCCQKLKMITIINFREQPLCKVTLTGQVPCPVLWLNNRVVHQIGAWGIHMLTFCLACLSPVCAAHCWHFWTSRLNKKKAKFKKAKIPILSPFIIHRSQSF